MVANSIFIQAANVTGSTVIVASSLANTLFLMERFVFWMRKAILYIKGRIA